MEQVRVEILVSTAALEGLSDDEVKQILGDHAFEALSLLVDA